MATLQTYFTQLFPRGGTIKQRKVLEWAEKRESVYAIEACGALDEALSNGNKDNILSLIRYIYRTYTESIHADNTKDVRRFNSLGSTIWSGDDVENVITPQYWKYSGCDVWCGMGMPEEHLLSLREDGKWEYEVRDGTNRSIYVCNSYRIFTRTDNVLWYTLIS